MNERERFFWEKMRGWTLPALIARLIEAYECSDARTMKVLKFRYLLGRHSRSENQINEGVADAVDVSDAASSRAILGKTLHDRSKCLSSYLQLLDAWYEDNRADVEELNSDIVLDDELHERSKWEKEEFEGNDLLDNPRFVSFLKGDASRFDDDADLKRAFAAEWGLDPSLQSFDLALRGYEKHKAQMKDGYFTAKSSSSSAIFWSKEMAGRLVQVVDREHGLERHPFGDVGELIPPAHRTLFENAHMLYLFDFDIPCILTCGALVEELVKREFPDLDEKWEQQFRGGTPVKWKDKVREVMSRNPAFKRAEPLLVRIMYARNGVAHDPGAYLGAGGNKAERVLLETRKVLEIFYETLQAQAEGTRL